MIDRHRQGMFDPGVTARIASESQPEGIHEAAASPNGTNKPNATASSSSLPGNGANEDIVQTPANLGDTIFSQKDFSWMLAAALQLSETTLHLLADMSSAVKKIFGDDARVQVFIQPPKLPGFLLPQVALFPSNGNGRFTLPIHSPSVFQEPDGLEAIQEEAKDMMNEQKVFFLMGEEWQSTAISIRSMRGKLKKRCSKEKIKVHIPAGPSGMYDLYVTKLPRLFKQCFRMGKDEELKLFKRKGDEPPVIGGFRRDHRKIIGLTEDGWRAWKETARFLAKYGGPGPWAQARIDDVAESDPKNAKRLGGR